MITCTLFTVRQHSYVERAVLAMIDSVRPSDCLSHAGIMPKRLQLGPCSLHWRIAHDSSFLVVNVTAKFRREPRKRGRRMREG